MCREYFQKQAEQLIRLYETELMDDLEGSSDVIDYKDLQDRTKHIISTKVGESAITICRNDGMS